MGIFCLKFDLLNPVVLLSKDPLCVFTDCVLHHDCVSSVVLDQINPEGLSIDHYELVDTGSGKLMGREELGESKGI